MHPYSWLLFGSAFIAALVAYVVWHRRSALGAGSVIALMTTLVIWSVTYALYWNAATVSLRKFWLNATYLGVVFVPLAFLCFSIQYTGQGKLLTGNRLMFLLVEPVSILALLWTDDFHGLFFAGKRPPDASIILDGGLPFWFNIVYSYLLVLAATLLLVRAIFHSVRLYRAQYWAVLTGALIPFASNILTILHVTPFPALDLTPVAFTLTGLFFALALFNFRLLDIAPIARNTLVDTMSEGVLVLDPQNRIVDINPVARRVVGDLPERQLIGANVAEAFSHWWNFLAAYRDVKDGHVELTMSESPRVELDLRISPLYDGRSHYLGRMIVWRDITVRKKTEAELLKTNQQLQEQLQEIQILQVKLREQAIHDPLTGLYNRWHLQDTLSREIERAERENLPIAILLIDIDRFKEINDNHGHAAGDQTLKALANLLLTHTRKMDFPCRYGGDEFLIVMPGMDRDFAFQRAVNIRDQFAGLTLPVTRDRELITLSIGIAILPQHGRDSDAILIAADQAMYAGKRAGGDRIAVAGE